MNTIAPMIMRDLPLNATQFGILCSTYLPADLIFLLPAGSILDHYFVEKVIALLLCLIGTIDLALSDSLLTASAYHFLSGIGNAFYFLNCMLLISRWIQKTNKNSVQV